MTREEFKKMIYDASKQDTSSPKDCIHLLSLHLFIEQIFYEHEAHVKDLRNVIDRYMEEATMYKSTLDKAEAQLKAKESDLERQDMIIKCLSMDLDSKEKLLKAKDEEIKGLGCRVCHAEGYISDLHNNPKDKKFYDKKARSIVAMLFWEWKKITRLTEGETMDEYDDGYDCGCVAQAEQLFKKAYKMLKDNA